MFDPDDIDAPDIFGDLGRDAISNPALRGGRTEPRLA